MPAMTKWIMGIFAAAVCGVALDLLFSGSKMRRTIRFASAAVTLLMLAAPIPAMLKGDISIFGSYESEYNAALDEGFLGYVAEQKAEIIEKATEKKLADEGLPGARVEVVFKAGGEEIEKVNINLENCVIDGDPEHINKNELARKLIKECVNIEDDRINIYG